MDDNLARRRRVSAAAELGASASLKDGEVIDVYPARESHPGPGRVGAAAAAAAWGMDRRNSVPPGSHQRHMPMEPLKMTIPRKNKEKKALFHYVSTESREYEDMMTILNASYLDTSSAGCFTYCKPRLVQSELLEKEFVEKRREMKSEGRTEKELEESYCFLLADNVKLPWLCEKGLLVGQSRNTVLGNPNKGVYLSRYSDLLQANPFTPGASGEILIFKVMKGKVKSMYENMKNLQDPTPRFDSHISKNASKVTSLTSYRAFELTQHYFYEYTFDELRQRPRQVCPYAVLSFHFKGKDSALTSKPLAPIRLNSQSAEGRKEPAQFTVWTGDLVKADTVLYQISLRSFSPPFLPHKLPEKLEIGWLMRLNQVTKMLPEELFSYNLYNSSQEVVNNNHFCSLLEVTDRNRATTSVTSLLQELEIKRVVLVTPLTERGFLILLSSVQMATPTERGESWKRCLQALFVFPQSRDVTKSTTRAPSSQDASESLMSAGKVMPRLTQFIPALHHALVKARANPPPQLSTGVEHQAREYLSGLNEGKVRQYPMGNYESNLDEEGKLFPPPNHHRVNMDSYLNSYLYNPAFYLLSVARVSAMVEAYCGPEEPQEVKLGRSCGGQREVTEKEATSNRRDGQTNTQKIQQLIDLVQTCKRNAENEINREEGGGGGVGISSGRKRRLEQETAVRAIKFLKASQEPGRHGKIPVDGNQVSASPGSLASVISLIGLRDVDLREDGSELAAKLLSLLTALTQTARETAVQEEVQKESFPFDKIATRLGLPTNCDIDLRKHDDLEEQMAGSVSSLEGFSPGSHSGEMNHHGAAGRGGGGGGLGRRAAGYEEEEEQWAIPWVLIPITGLCSERYTQRDRNIPQDPRFQHLTTAPSITTTTKPSRTNPTPSPEPSLPPFPFLSSSPEPSPPGSPSQCPSPDPSPPPSPSQCPSPEPSPPASPSQCPSPEPSPLPSPSQCPSPQPSPPTSPSQYLSPKLSHPPSPTRCQPPEPDELHSGANKELLAPTAFREFTGVSQDREEKPQGKEKKNEEPSISASIQPSLPPAPERRTQHSLPPTEQEKEDDEVELMEVDASPLDEEKETRPVEKLQMQEEEEEAEVVEMIHVVGSDEEQKGEAKELLGGSMFPVTSPRPCPLRHIDNIVDKHLGDFSSEMQDVLQEESVHYSFPQSPHSTSNTDTAALQHTLPPTPLSQFSQYVSFYNPCPPVQDYVDSLQDSINSVLAELGDSWPSHKPAPSGTNIDAALANTVSAFVSSIRAANIKTGVDDSDGEVTAADVGQTPALSREEQVWPPHSINKPNPTDGRNPPNSHVTLSVTTSAPGLLYKPTNTAVLHSPPDMSPQSNWNPQQSCTLEISRTVTPNTRKTQDDCITRTVHFTPGADGGTSVSGTVEVTLPGFSDLSKPLTEASHSTEPVSSSASVSVNTPVSAPAADLSSLISQLQPEVFNNLVEIIKDVKRNSLQFYLHSAEREDRVHEDIKEHLLKQGNVEQSPVAFLNQENSDSRLLVIIKNKDIAGHLHKIPGLVSLKRHPSVVFVGIDTLDDIRNNSYNELFVSGGCIVSDELVLNPDFMSHDRLTSLLMILEQHSSPESLWRWKIHHKTHKKLKEQSRFRRDAANLLDVLSAYQKRHIVEFLPYHHCDTNHQSPDLNCLLELQARYTQYRHTVLLTEQFEKFPAYSSSGIIVATIEEILHDFTRLVGYHQGNKNSQPIMDDILASKGLGRQLSHSDSVSEHSPSIFPEHIHPLSSRDQPQHLLHQSGSGLPPLSHLSDQLVPDTSCKEGGPQPSGKDLEDLRLAISQLRAERQAQLQQQQRFDSQVELSINPLKSFLPNPVSTGSRHTTPPLRPTEPAPLNPGKKAVAATLEFIHSALQTELEDELRETEAEGRRSRGRREQRDGTPVRTVGSIGGNLGPNNSDTSTASYNPNTAAVTEPSNQTDATNGRREKADQHGAAYSSSNARPAEGDRSRDTQLGPDQPVRDEAAPHGNSTLGTAIGTKVTGSITTVTDQKDNPNLAVPSVLQLQLPQQHRQNLNNHQQLLQQSHLHLQQPPHGQQRGTNLLQPPHLPHLHNQHFPHSPLLGPLTNLGGGLLGPTPVWPGAMGPSGAAALVWGFPGGRDFTGSRLMGGYHNPAGQGSNMYRGGQRGGGFNGM